MLFRSPYPYESFLPAFTSMSVEEFAVLIAAYTVPSKALIQGDRDLSKALRKHCLPSSQNSLITSRLAAAPESRADPRGRLHLPGVAFLAAVLARNLATTEQKLADMKNRFYDDMRNLPASLPTDPDALATLQDKIMNRLQQIQRSEDALRDEGSSYSRTTPENVAKVLAQ